MLDIYIMYTRRRVASQHSMLPIVNQSAWQAVVWGEHLKKMTQWMILVWICSTQAVMSSCAMGMCCFRSAYKQLLCCSHVQCETSIRSHAQIQYNEYKSVFNCLHSLKTKATAFTRILDKDGHFDNWPIRIKILKVMT